MIAYPAPNCKKLLDEALLIIKKLSKHASDFDRQTKKERDVTQDRRN